MGRRKIEIQPITHERNRSVTFLKRKHGLFKKAYELGVLCSVDVAVIIFEQKPGHHLKLYQYCSSDVHDIVQRHIHHDGEKDTRGPADFSGIPNVKFEEYGEGGEDDEVDEDEDVPRGVKRHHDGYIKPEDISLDVDLGYGHVPAGPPSVYGMTSSVPLSSDRHLHHHNSPTMANKKTRFAGGSPSTRSPKTSYPYGSSTTSPNIGRDQHGQNAYSHSFFPNTAASPATYQPESSFDTTHPSKDSRNNTSGTPNYPPRSTAYDAALYTPVIRQQQQGINSGQSSGNEAFKFIDKDPARNRAPATSASAVHMGNNLDWPNSGYSSNVTQGTNSTSPASDTTWLDFLSNSPAHGTHSGGNAPHATGRRNSESLLWERGPSTRSSLSVNPSLPRSMAILGDGERRSRLNSSGSAGEDVASGGKQFGMGASISSIKQEKDAGS